MDAWRHLAKWLWLYYYVQNAPPSAIQNTRITSWRRKLNIKLMATRLAELSVN